MKNKIILPILSLFLIAIGVGACEDNTNSVQKDHYNTVSGKITVIEIDSCQYIISPVYAGYEIIHKQNCRFCSERAN
jgi:hypothetical protein